MNKTKLFNRTGFTLMELLIVMAIVIALMAIMVPALMNNQKKARIGQAKMGVNNLEKALELYSTENRGYPTTEQGLYMLFYIPDQLAAAPTMTGINPGMTPDMMMPGSDPNSQFGGGAGSVGGPNMSAGGMTPPGQPIMTPPMMPGGAGFDTQGMGSMDPTMGSGMPGMDMNGTGTSLTAWTQPIYNQQLYTMKKLRSVPYLDSEDSLKDPWGTPYRYDNNMQYYGLNKTGDAKPAVWSAGPDKQDDTDDDIRNWDPVEAQAKIAQRQQMGNGMMGTGAVNNPDDPFAPMNNPQMNNPADPFAQPSMTQPGGMNGMPPTAPPAMPPTMTPPAMPPTMPPPAMPTPPALPPTPTM